MEYLTRVSDVTYPDGSIGPCYAIVGNHGTGTAVTVKRAIELQQSEMNYLQPHPVYPDDFTVWYAPDFPQIRQAIFPNIGPETPGYLG